MSRGVFWLTLFLAIVLAACDISGALPTDSTSSTNLSRASVSVRPAQTPDTSPRPAEELAVVGALANAGIRASFVAPSKFDWILGDAARRSGVFTATVDGIQTRADVLFLDVPANDVTVCTEGAMGETKFIVRRDGRVIGTSPVTGSAAGPLYFAMSDHFFVISPNVRVRDALQFALALSVPRC